MTPELTSAVCMMQMGSFEMRVRRSVKGGAGASTLSASSTNGSESAYPTPAPGMDKQSFALWLQTDDPYGGFPHTVQPERLHPVKLVPS